MRGYTFAGCIDGRYLMASMQRNMIFLIPIPVVNDDLLHISSASQDGREHDPVIIRMRLGAEYRNIPAIGVKLEKMLDRAHPRHAVANEN
ncbi:hypothetical protein D3C78_837780 [compost metagenome]